MAEKCPPKDEDEELRQAITLSLEEHEKPAFGTGLTMRNKR